MTDGNVSPIFSAKGWDWRIWLKGNKESVKIVVSLVFGILVTNNIVEAGVSSIIVKAVLDLVDFYVSKVDL